MSNLTIIIASIIIAGVLLVLYRLLTVLSVHVAHATRYLESGGEEEDFLCLVTGRVIQQIILSDKLILDNDFDELTKTLKQFKIKDHEGFIQFIKENHEEYGGIMGIYDYFKKDLYVQSALVYWITHN